MKNTSTQRPMFQQHLRHVPEIDPAEGFLVMDGYVRQTLTLKYNTLIAMPSLRVPCVLACTGHTSDTPLIIDGTWEGIAMNDLIAQTQPTEKARYANFHSADGYATHIPIEQLDNAILAHSLNSTRLHPENGAPLRLIIPGVVGYKLPKWIQHIIFTDTPVSGYWEQQGWPITGEALPLATLSPFTNPITTAESIILNGHAYGGSSPLASVEVKIDHSDWMQATISTSPDGELARWQIRWAPSAPGHYHAQVRAISANGHIQPEHTQPSTTIQVLS